jgi:hypothetical protein
VLGGLAVVAAALGLDAGDAAAAGRAVRRRLEADGDRCLLVFDNAADPADLLPFLPAAGCARSFKVRMAASLAVRMCGSGEGPAGVSRRGLGVRGGVVVVSLP